MTEKKDTTNEPAAAKPEATDQDGRELRESELDRVSGGGIRVPD